MLSVEPTPAKEQVCSVRESRYSNCRAVKKNTLYFLGSS